MKRGPHEKKTLTVREHMRDKELEIKEHLIGIVEAQRGRKAKTAGASKKKAPKHVTSS